MSHNVPAVPLTVPVTPHELAGRAVTAAARAAFDPRGDEGGVHGKEIISTCAALVAFLDLVAIMPLTTAQWRDVVETLGVDPSVMLSKERK